MWRLTDPLHPVLGRFYRAVGSDLLLRLKRRRLLLGEGSEPAQADPELPAFDPGSAEAPAQRNPAHPVFTTRASPQRLFGQPGSPVQPRRRPATAAAPAPQRSPAQFFAGLTPTALRAAGAAASQSPLWQPAVAPAAASAPTVDQRASSGSQEPTPPPAASRGEATAGPAPPQTRNQAAIAGPIGGQAAPSPAPADPSSHRQEPLAAPPGVEAAPGLMPGSAVYRSQAAIGSPAATGAEAAPGLMPGSAVRSQAAIGAPGATRAASAPGLMPGEPAHTGQAALSSPVAASAQPAAVAPLPARAEQSPLLRLIGAAAQRWHRRTTLQTTAGSMLASGELVVPAGSDRSPVVPGGRAGRGTAVVAPGATPAQEREPAPAFTSHPRWSGAPAPAVAGGPPTAALRLPDAMLPSLPTGGFSFEEAAGGDEFLFEERVRRVLDRILRTDALRHGLTLGER